MSGRGRGREPPVDPSPFRLGDLSAGDLSADRVRSRLVVQREFAAAATAAVVTTTTAATPQRFTAASPFAHLQPADPFRAPGGGLYGFGEPVDPVQRFGARVRTGEAPRNLPHFPGVQASNTASPALAKEPRAYLRTHIDEVVLQEFDVVRIRAEETGLLATAGTIQALQSTSYSQSKYIFDFMASLATLSPGDAALFFSINGYSMVLRLSLLITAFASEIDPMRQAWLKSLLGEPATAPDLWLQLQRELSTTRYKLHLSEIEQLNQIFLTDVRFLFHNGCLPPEELLKMTRDSLNMANECGILLRARWQECEARAEWGLANELLLVMVRLVCALIFNWSSHGTSASSKVPRPIIDNLLIDVVADIAGTLELPAASHEGPPTPRTRPEPLWDEHLLNMIVALSQAGAAWNRATSLGHVRLAATIMRRGDVLSQSLAAELTAQGSQVMEQLCQHVRLGMGNSTQTPLYDCIGPLLAPFLVDMCITAPDTKPPRLSHATIASLADITHDNTGLARDMFLTVVALQTRVLTADPEAWREVNPQVGSTPLAVVERALAAQLARTPLPAGVGTAMDFMHQASVRTQQPVGALHIAAQKQDTLSDLRTVIAVLMGLGYSPYRKMEKHLVGVSKLADLAVAPYAMALRMSTTPTPVFHKCLPETEAGLEVRVDVEGSSLPLTPLMLAVQMNHPDLVLYFLERGADPNARTLREHGNGSSTHVNWTPLHFAVVKTPALVELLIRHGANVATADTDCSSGESLLYLSCQAYAVETTKLLLAHGAIMRTEAGSPLQAVVMSRSSTISAPKDASMNERVALVRLLTAHGADVNADLMTPEERPGQPRSNVRTRALHYAVQHMLPRLVQVLLDCGAWLHALDNSWITATTNRDVARLLFAHGWAYEHPDPNASSEARRNRSALMKALRSGEAWLIEMLLDHGAEVFAVPRAPALVGFAAAAEQLQRPLAAVGAPGAANKAGSATAISMMVPIQTVGRAFPEATCAVFARLLVTYGVAPELIYLPGIKWNDESVVPSSRKPTAAFVTRTKDVVAVYMPWRPELHRYTPHSFRLESRALALLRMTGTEPLASLPLEVFELVLDTLFQIERTAHGRAGM